MDRLKVALGFYNGGEFAKSLDCTKLLTNWDDVTISLNRENYTGVVRNISTKFIFSSEAKEEILRYYKDYYLSTQIKINVYQISERWDYSLIFSGYLDFSTLEYDDYTLSINAKDNTLASAINANKSTKYDIPTYEIRADKKLKYDRMRILNRIQWTTDDANEETNEPYKFKLKQVITQEKNELGEVITHSSISYYIPIPLAYMASGTYRCPFEYKDQSQELIKKGDGFIPDSAGIVKAISENAFRLNTKFKCKLLSNIGVKSSIVIGSTNSSPIAEKEIRHGNEITINLNAPIINAKGQTFGVFLKVDFLNFKPSGNDVIEMEYSALSEKDGYYSRGSIAYAECFGRGDDIEYNCIDVNKLANKLAKKIYPTANTVIDTLPIGCVLVSGEDMRGLNNAKITTSFNEFSSFMETCFGYTYTIDDNTIRFGRREVLFKNDVVKEITSYSELNFTQDTSLIYSKVKVGYNKQDYSNNNGSNEFNQSIEYSTGLNLTNNSLELISPYRADGYGFEFKTQEIENEVKDKTLSLEDEDKDEVDKDIFIIEVEDVDTHYIPYREYPAFIPSQVFSNGADIGIEKLYILKSIDDKYEVGDFVNFYLTTYSIDTTNTYAMFEFGSVGSNAVVDTILSFLVTVKRYTSGIVTYNTNNAIITIDWDKLNSKLSKFNVTSGKETLNYPVSYSCYKRDVLNYNLNPKLCANRNQFTYLACTSELKFASSEGNSNIIFYDGGLIRLNDDITFGGRYMTVNKLKFYTNETILPQDKSGMVSLLINNEYYSGWIISANQNIGKNEPCEYELILAES